MSLKAKVEAIIYAAEEPITLEQLAQLLKDAVLADLAAARENLAIEQADSAAEALASQESELLPDLAPQSSEPAEASPTLPAEPEDEVVPPPSEPEAADSAAVAAPEATARKRQPKKSEQEIAEDKAVRARLRDLLVELVTDYASEDRGMEIRQVAGGFRMATKPEHHDVVRAFAKSLKPPIRLSLAALETLAVIAYKQPVTGPEISEIRGVESTSVLGTLLDRKLITTAGRKQVIGRPMQYKTSKDFLLRFGLNDVNELPSMEEFSQLVSDSIEVAPSETQPTPSLFEPDVQPAAASDAGAPYLPQSADVGGSQPGAAANQPDAESDAACQPEAEHPIGQ